MTDPKDATPSGESDDADLKVMAIFRELIGERAARLGPMAYNSDAKDAIVQALAPSSAGSSPENGVARDIAFHLTDWASDAAFIVAVQLFPERFTADEIANGVQGFLIHAPNHVAAAASLSGWPVEDIFEVGFGSDPHSPPPSIDEPGDEAV